VTDASRRRRLLRVAAAAAFAFIPPRMHSTSDNPRALFHLFLSSRIPSSHLHPPLPRVPRPSSLVRVPGAQTPRPDRLTGRHSSTIMVRPRPTTSARLSLSLVPRASRRLPRVSLFPSFHARLDDFRASLSTTTTTTRVALPLGVKTNE